MHRRLIPIVVAIATSAARLSVADTIVMNLDPVGTTSNQNLFGTVLTDGSATWPARNSLAYRDYQFELLTASGSTTFDNFSLQLSAQLRNSTATDNTLRATLWTGPIVSNPLLSNSLLTITTPNSSFVNGSNGFSSLMLTGEGFEQRTITTTPSIFFFRVWAEGVNSNAGFQTKMAGTLGEFANVTMSPSPTIDGYIDFDTNGDGTIDSSEQSTTRDLIAEVPEPSTIVLALLAVSLAAAAVRPRRRN